VSSYNINNVKRYLAVEHILDRHYGDVWKSTFKQFPYSLNQNLDFLRELEVDAGSAVRVEPYAE
jgi:hypothetical protein